MRPAGLNGGVERVAAYLESNTEEDLMSREVRAADSTLSFAIPVGWPDLSLAAAP